jgi:hypothetical protein
MEASLADERIEQLLTRAEITDVLCRYCRGIDRRDFDLVRSCYHPDAAEEHGDYAGDVDGFLERAATNLARCERTMHFLGNVLIEISGQVARSETYAVAYHRMPALDADRGPRDRVVGLRYLDLFTLRDGQWRISSRRCVCEWTRTDPVVPGFEFPAGWLRGSADGGDPVCDESWRSNPPPGL